MSFQELFRELFKPRPLREPDTDPSASAYLMLARSTVDGRPLSLGIYSTTALATHGRYKYELVDRPYATTRAVAYGAAEKRLRTALLLDPDPWPEDIHPLVQELLNPPKAENAYREPARHDTRRSYKPLDPYAIDAAVELLLEAGFDSTHERARVIERLAALKVTP